MKKRVAVGSSIGAMIETYDFIGFGIAAALYFNKVFFPANDPLSGTLLSFATLGIGFAVRPLGGIIGGILGDKIGRKPVLVGSLLLMGGATVLIGALPTYQQVGVWAGILLVIVRVVQGLAFGAEWGGAILMTFEHAPWRKKGLYTGVTQAGFPVGLLLANFAFLISVPLGDQWAWRVPFLLSAVLIVVGIFIRLKVEESPEFEELKEEGDLSKNPLDEVLRDDWRNILRAFCLRIAETAGYAVSVTFMLSYISSEKLAGRSTTLTATMIAAAIGIFATTFFGAWTDKIGRRPVYILGSAIMVAWGIPLFLTVNTGSAVLIIVAFVISYSVCQNSLAGVQGAWFCELFNANTRTTRRLAGLPDVRGRLRLHPADRDRALHRHRLDRTGDPVQLLRPARPARRPGDPGDLGQRPSATRSRPSSAPSRRRAPRPRHARTHRAGQRELTP